MNVTDVKLIEISDVFKDCPLAWEVFVCGEMMSDLADDEGSYKRLVPARHIIDELHSADDVEQEERAQIDLVINRLENIESNAYVNLESAGSLPSAEKAEMANRFKGIFENYRSPSEECEKFYDGLNEGDVVHYHWCFNRFIRCRVNKDKELVPFALVGEWKVYEPMDRYRDILGDKTFRPNTKDVCEAVGRTAAAQKGILVEVWTLGGILKRPSIDPTNLAPCTQEPPKP